MSDWRTFRRFVKEVNEVCAKPLGFELRFESTPSDTGEILVKKGLVYVPASFLGDSDKLNEFEACVSEVSKDYASDVILSRGWVDKQRTKVLSYVYFPADEDGPAYAGIPVSDFDELKDVIKRRGLL